MPPDSGSALRLIAHQLVAGVREQRFESFGLRLERGGGPDADVDLLAVDDDRLCDVASDPVAQHLDRRGTRRAHGEHELVAAESRREQVGPADLVDSPGHRREHLVADRFAVQLVDRTELGDVDDHQAEATALSDQVVRSAHEAVAVEQAGAVVVVGEEFDAVARVREGGRDLARDDVAADRRVVGEVVDGELARHEFTGRGDEPGVEMHRLLYPQDGHRVEDRLAVVFVDEADERASGDEFGVVTEQPGDGTVDRADLAVGVDQGDHAVHVRHHRPQHGGLALVEFEAVSVGGVTGDQHGDLAVVEALHRPADLEGDPDAGSAANPHHDELARVLLAHRRQRGDRDVQVVGMDHVEHRSSDELLVGPTENADGAFVGVAQGAPSASMAITGSGRPSSDGSGTARSARLTKAYRFTMRSA